MPDLDEQTAEKRRADELLAAVPGLDPAGEAAQAPTADPRVTLFCLPHAGGSPLVFRPLLAALPLEIDAVPVDRRGEGPGRTFGEAVDDMAGRIADRTGEGSYALYGHGLGGLFAYEVARRLVRDGHEPPRHLFVSAGRPPQRRGERDGRAPVHTYPDQAFLGALASTGGVPEEILRDPAAVEYFASRLRPEYALLCGYRHTGPEPRLTCPVTVVTGSEDAATSPRDLDLWAELTTGPVAHLELAGAGHLFLDSHAEAVAARVHRTLRARPRTGPAAPPAPDLFRDAMARLAAPVTVVTAWDAEGRARAFTASAVCSLSADPPLLLVCLARSSRAHEVFTGADRFLVNVLGHEQAAAAQDFAGPDRTAAEASLVPLELGLPGLPDASARFACTGRQVLPGGDHSILTGRLEAVAISDAPPLIHHRRGWHRPVPVS
ncbi:alpha/beta fold hydrolase [Streptomyces acidiscabies]|nr:alpha/beta fold hydrolase [Streptomyces acidiscabies]